MEHKELLIIKNAITKYERLNSYLKMASKGIAIRNIINDLSIIKYNCEFGLWYFNEGQEYSNLNSFQNIQEPYENMFKNYYELIAILSKKFTNFGIKIPFYSSTQRKEAVGNKLKIVQENCEILIKHFKELQLDIVNIDRQIREVNTYMNKKKTINQLNQFKSPKTNLELVEVEDVSSKINNFKEILSNIEIEYSVLEATKSINEIENYINQDRAKKEEILIEKNRQSDLNQKLIETKINPIVEKAIIADNQSQEIKVSNESIIENKKIEDNSITSFLRMSRSLK